MQWIPMSTSADQTSAAKENHNFSYESSRAHEISEVEENLNLFRESSAFWPSMRGFKLTSLNIASLPKHINWRGESFALL